MISRLMAVTLLLVAAALPALADDAALPDLTPKGQYLVMTQDDATSTSKCIGDPKTLLCAVETMMACWYRANDAFCRIAMGLDRNPDIAWSQPGPDVIYRIVRREVLTDRKFPWSPRRDLSWRPGGLIMQAGDIRIDITEVNCYEEISLKSCQHHWDSPLAYFVRHQGDRWVVIVWGDPYDPRNY
jgi:hypothetical protein